jgi:hypothetical protein
MPDSLYKVNVTKVIEVFTVAADEAAAKTQAENYCKRIAVAKTTAHMRVTVTSGDAVVQP